MSAKKSSGENLAGRADATPTGRGRDPKPDSLNDVPMAWLRGVPGSPADYYHSEGACCPFDEEPDGTRTHATCKVDADYTLRKALDIALGIDRERGSVPSEWCRFCRGFDVSCIFCHSAAELIAGNRISLSQRQLAFDTLDNDADCYRAVVYPADSTERSQLSPDSLKSDPATESDTQEKS